MPSGAVALERETVAFGSLPLAQDLVDPGVVIGAEPEVSDRRVGLKMALISGTHDDGSHLRPLEDGAARNGRDVAATEIGDVAQGLEQLLEQIAQEEPLKSWLREAPSVLGVVQLTDVAQVERVVAQTTPGNRLQAERFMRERITARITEEGIKVPPMTGAVAPVGDAGIGL